jgi:hypothetical protein
MGVTIHFAGTLRDEASIAGVEQTARAYAGERGWDVLPVDHAVNAEGDYTGVTILPGKMCEPVHLVFDAQLHVDEYTKTQFAGADTHIAVLGLLRDVQSWFRVLKVSDEGEYWDTEDRTQLELHLRVVAETLERNLREYPGSAVGVLLPSGRIVDMYRAKTPEAAAALANAQSPRKAGGLFSRFFGRRPN